MYCENCLIIWEPETEANDEAQAQKEEVESKLSLVFENETYGNFENTSQQRKKSFT